MPSTKDLMGKIVRELDESRYCRGQIIDEVILMESLLNEIIARYFTKDKERRRTFREFVLDKEFFTLHQKIKIFSELKLHKSAKFKGKFEGLTERLFEANSIRNKIAHLNNLKNRFNVKLNNKTKNVNLNKSFELEFFQFIHFTIYDSLLIILKSYS